MLPIVISPLVDARYGPTAVLGIPELDVTDASIAQRLAAKSGAAAGRAWKAVVKSSGGGEAPRATVRYRARDFAISRQRAWGAPIPLVHCPDCGIVPVPYRQLPVRLPEDLQVTGVGNPLDERTDFTEAVSVPAATARPVARPTRSTATSTGCGCGCRSACPRPIAPSTCSTTPNTAVGCRRGRSSGAPTPAVTCSISASSARSCRTSTSSPRCPDASPSPMR